MWILACLLASVLLLWSLPCGYWLACSVLVFNNQESLVVLTEYPCLKNPQATLYQSMLSLRGQGKMVMAFEEGGEGIVK